MRTITLTIADDVSDADALAAVVNTTSILSAFDARPPISHFVGGIIVEAIADAQGGAFLIQKGVK
jgi:hypothetical protein